MAERFILYVGIRTRLRLNIVQLSRSKHGQKTLLFWLLLSASSLSPTLVFSQACEPIVLIEHLPYADTQDVALSGPVLIGDSGYSISLTGSRWRAIFLDATITEDSILEFDFSSTRQGDIHGIGFDNDVTETENQFFRIYGQQSYGISDFAYSGLGTQKFVLPVGQYFKGSFLYLTFVVDDDVNSAATSVFSNIRLYNNDAERQACNNDLPCFPIKAKNNSVAVICL